MVATSLAGPRYVECLRTGTLARRAVEARRHLSACDLCARRCGIDRVQGLAGAACRTGALAVVGSYGAHFGSRRPARPLVVHLDGNGTHREAWQSGPGPAPSAFHFSRR